jgi:hypothetical protein
MAAQALINAAMATPAATFPGIEKKGSDNRRLSALAVGAFGGAAATSSSFGRKSVDYNENADRAAFVALRSWEHK